LIVGVDSSLLVSLYVRDGNSLAAGERMSVRPEVWLTPLNRSELEHAIYRYVYRRRFGDFEALLAWQKFEVDCAIGIWSIVPFPEGAWMRSIELARQYGPLLGMRTLDSLHVACALELGAERFWTFDERQAKLAEMVGLNTKP
jgi:predicted nucleic acid-binding protein